MTRWHLNHFVLCRSASRIILLWQLSGEGCLIWEATLKKAIRLLLLGCLLAVFYYPGKATAAKNDYFCVSESGPKLIVTSVNPLHTGDKCAFRSAITHYAFNTTNLTWNLSADFDISTGAFSSAAAGGTTEYIPSGEDLVVMDFKQNGRNLVYSRSSHRLFFARLSDIPKQLLPHSHFLRHAAHNDGAIFFTAAGGTKFFATKDLRIEGQLRHGRIVTELDSFFDSSTQQEMVLVKCLSVSCLNKEGWVLRSELAEIKLAPIENGPLPTIKEHPRQYLFKECSVKLKSTSSNEIKEEINFQFSMANVLGFEVGGALEKIYKNAREQEYPETLEVEWTVFTVTNFKPHRIGRGRSSKFVWMAKKPFVLIVEWITHDCLMKDKQTRFRILTQDNHVNVGSAQKELLIRNTLEHMMFVREASATLNGRVKEWLLRHIASGLSTKKPRTN